MHQLSRHHPHRKRQLSLERLITLHNSPLDVPAIDQLKHRQDLLLRVGLKSNGALKTSSSSGQLISSLTPSCITTR